jgi:hypothetical protein
MGNVVTMLRRLVRPEWQAAARARGTSSEKKQDEEEKEVIDAMKILDTNFNEFVDIIDGSIEHTLILLELNDPSRKARKNLRKQFSTDPANAEAYSGESSPGQPQYLNTLEKRVAAFRKFRLSSLRAWKEETAIDQSQMTFNFASQFPTMNCPDDKTPPTRSQQELLLLLWVSQSIPHEIFRTKQVVDREHLQHRHKFHSQAR